MQSRTVDLLADIRWQAEKRGGILGQRCLEQVAMAQVLGMRRDWATWIGPLIPRLNLLKARASYKEERDEEMSFL